VDATVELPRAPLAPVLPAAPVRLEVDYRERCSKALALTKWLLAAPHWIALALLAGPVAAAVAGAAVCVTLTGRYPEPLFAFVTGAGRWLARVGAYVLLLTDTAPPFALYDQPSQPVRLHVDPPRDGRLPRWRPLLGWLLIVPQTLALAVLTVGVALLTIISAFAVAATGHLRRDLFELVLFMMRWYGQLLAYAFFLVDTYPSWRLLAEV
jgi:hypothetical protein